MLEEKEFDHLLIKIETKPGPNMTRQHYAVFADEDMLQDGKPLMVEVENIKSHFASDLRMYNYFESMINLVSLMCLSRNYKGINEL